MFKYNRAFVSNSLIGKHFELQTDFWYHLGLDELEAENIALGWQTQRNDKNQLVIFSDTNDYVQVWSLIDDTTLAVK